MSDVEAIADKVFIMNAGQIIASGTVQELAEQVRGKVWELTVPREQARLWQADFTVANYRHEGDDVVLRIISDEKPSPEAVTCDPILDDAYLYRFGEKEA